METIELNDEAMMEVRYFLKTGRWKWTIFCKTMLVAFTISLAAWIPIFLIDSTDAKVFFLFISVVFGAGSICGPLFSSVTLFPSYRRHKMIKERCEKFVGMKKTVKRLLLLNDDELLMELDRLEDGIVNE